MNKKLLLVGGGHAHLHILKELQTKPVVGVDVTLISPSPYFFYSGMLSGFVEGLYKESDLRCDLRKLSQSAGVSFLEDRAAGIDPVTQLLYTDRTKQQIAYDVVSFDIGSEAGGAPIPGAAENSIRVKPIDQFIHLIDHFDMSARTVVVGGGASGIELALAIQERKHKHSMADPVTLVSSGALLSKPARSKQRKIIRIMTRKGVQLRINDGVTEVHQKEILLKSGNQVPYDRLLMLTGPKAPDLFQNSGLKVRDEGYLLVSPTLQSVDFPNIFGAGDCVAIDGHLPLPKSGVYAVREAPLLWKNLLRFLDGNRLLTYRPQPHFLSLLSTGNHEAFFLYRNVLLHGKWCWKLKYMIDNRFIKQYQTRT